MARLAGVSVATASRSLTGRSDKVSAATLRKVHDAATTLGYRPNLSARQVSQGRTDAVALVASDLAGSYLPRVVTGFLVSAERQQLAVTVAASEPHHELDAATVSSLRGLRPRALVLAGSRVIDADVEAALLQELLQFEADGSRVVVVGEPGLPFDTVVIDHASSSRALVHALVDLGYRSFGILAGPRRLLMSEQRLRGFRAGLEERGIGIPDSAVLRTHFSRDGGYVAAGELLSRDLRLEIVLAVDDSIAVGALTRWREAGMHVPDDLALAGFGGSTILRDVYPDLTTLAIPTHFIGEEALRLAMLPMAPQPRELTISGEPAIGVSTPRLPRAAHRVHR
ncbi:LacI family DNA-binding transcriptional regulator [Occultella kanbiaonis]|uniref:LacI family DNA-binding transcriptional regulator n=1 Tax=Occultella kanbiaonis TaxID=2675754 RepID=UPI0013D5F1F4|nr:LacI family DNA-binding transcriptional regulator [Occultella kanbiaonis]